MRFLEEYWNYGLNDTVTEAPEEMTTETATEEPRQHRHRRGRGRRQEVPTIIVPQQPETEVESAETEGSSDELDSYYNVTVYQYIRAVRKNKKGEK